MTVAQTFTGAGASADPEADRIAWHYRRMQEVEKGTYKPKSPSPDFEPLPGWRPFAGYGTDDPVAIIAKAARDQDTLALIPGDYFDITVNNHPMRYILVDFDRYFAGLNTKHHAFLIPEYVYPEFVTYQKDSQKYLYPGSDLHKWEEETYYPMLPKNVRDVVIPVRINDGYNNDAAHVFSPSAVEIYGVNFESGFAGSSEKYVLRDNSQYNVGIEPDSSFYVYPNYHVDRFRGWDSFYHPVSKVTKKDANDNNSYWLRGNNVYGDSQYSNPMAMSSWSTNDDTRLFLNCLNLDFSSYPMPCFCIG